MAKLLPAFMAVLMLSACSGVSVEDYANFQPKLDPVVFFDGKLTAHIF